MTATVLRADALALPLADESVDLVVTSPPYFGLRSYTDGGQHYAGQLGSEATPAEFVDALLATTREMVRVVKRSGSIWINLGDKYNSASNAVGYKAGRTGTPYVRGQGRRPFGEAAPHKSLLGIPWRYALACIDQLGLILRAEVIWSKPNGLPESVTDRVRRSHEQWFHFTREPQYYSAIDEVREEQLTDLNRTGWKRPMDTKWQRRADGGDTRFRAVDRTNHALGKLPGSVWTIPTEPLTVPPFYGVLGGRTVDFFWDEAAGIRWMRRVGVRHGRPSVRRMSDHFAAFPTEWPRRIVAGWSPPGICVECGEGRRPVANKGYLSTFIPGEDYEPPDTWAGSRDNPRDRAADGTFLPRERYVNKGLLHGRGRSVTRMGDGARVTITGYVCACTPYTDHPGTGEDSGPSHAAAIAAGDYYRADENLTGWGTSSFTNRPRVGPLREYHHDRWTPTPTRPAVVLDPFGGTGTVALVADVLGRHGVTVDLSADYNRLAAWRTTDPAQRAKAARVEKPPPVIDGQLTLEVGT
jgi:DNA modification methylase